MALACKKDLVDVNVTPVTRARLVLISAQPLKKGLSVVGTVIVSMALVCALLVGLAPDVIDMVVAVGMELATRMMLLVGATMVGQAPSAVLSLCVPTRLAQVTACVRMAAACVGLDTVACHVRILSGVVWNSVEIMAHAMSILTSVCVVMVGPGHYALSRQGIVRTNAVATAIASMESARVLRSSEATIAASWP